MYTPLKPGYTASQEIVVRVCKSCGCSIETSLCNWECSHDDQYNRPTGTVVVRTWQITNTLISEEEE